MRARNPRIALLCAAGLALALAGCSGGTLDDADGPETVLEVENTNIQPARAALDPLFGGCSITVTDATVSLRNHGKNSLAGGSPFNDIVMETVLVSYRWDDPTITTPPQTFNLGATVPASGIQTVRFPPIPLGLLDSSMIGHTANLEMLFTGRQISGTRVQADGGGVFSIGGSCI